MISAALNLNSQLLYAPDFIYISVPIEYDNHSSQIRKAERLFYCKTKRIFMNIKWVAFFHTHCIMCGVLHRNFWILLVSDRGPESDFFVFKYILITYFLVYRGTH